MPPSALTIIMVRAWPRVARHAAWRAAAAPTASHQRRPLRPHRHSNSDSCGRHTGIAPVRPSSRHCRPTGQQPLHRLRRLLRRRHSHHNPAVQLHSKRAPAASAIRTAFTATAEAGARPAAQRSALATSVALRLLVCTSTTNRRRLVSLWTTASRRHLQCLQPCRGSGRSAHASRRRRTRRRSRRTSSSIHSSGGRAGARLLQRMRTVLQMTCCWSIGGLWAYWI